MTKIRSAIILLLFLLAAFLTDGCGGSESGTSDIDPNAAQNLFTDSSSDEVLIGTFSFNGNSGGGYTEQLDEDNCLSTCYINMPATVRMFYMPDSNTASLYESSVSEPFSVGTIYSDYTFDFSFLVLNVEGDTETMSCTAGAYDVFRCNYSKYTVIASCSSPSTGACKIFYTQM